MQRLLRGPKIKELGVSGAGRTPSLWHRALWVGPQRRRRRWKRRGDEEEGRGPGTV